MERTPIPTHRSVSFSHKLSHPFDGTAFANGVCLGDVDNDGGHELVVAATEGQVRRCLPASCHLAALLYAWNPAPFLFFIKNNPPQLLPSTYLLQLSIYKGTNPVPWRGPENQGTFTCVTVGDIKNTGSNAVVCATAEGVRPRLYHPSSPRNNPRATLLPPSYPLSPPWGCHQCDTMVTRGG